MEKLKALEQRAEKDGLFIDYTPVAAMPGYGAVMAIVSGKNGKRIVRTSESTHKEYPLTEAFKKAGMMALCAYYGINMQDQPVIAANQVADNEGSRPETTSANISDKPTEVPGNNGKAAQQSATGRNSYQTTGAGRMDSQAVNKPTGTRQNSAGTAKAQQGGAKTVKDQQESTGAANERSSNAGTSSAEGKAGSIKTDSAAKLDASEESGIPSNSKEQETTASSTAETAQQSADATAASQDKATSVAGDFEFTQVLALKGQVCSEVTKTQTGRKFLRNVAGFAKQGIDNVKSIFRDDVVHLLKFLELHKEDEYGKWYFV